MTKSDIKSVAEHQRHETNDPVLLMLGIGKQLWRREPGDRFVERLRSEDSPPPFEGRLDAPAQTKVAAGLREEMAGRGLNWVLHRASLARNFARVLVMSGGKLQEQGRFEELDRKDSLTALLMAAE